MIIESCEQTIKRITWVGAIVNIVLSVAKITVGYVFNSRTLIADGVHSMSDLISDAAVLIGVRFWSSGPDAEHTYGHARMETLVTVFIGVLLFVVAALIAIDAYESIGEVKQAPSWIAAVVALVSIVSKEWLFRWTRLYSRKIASSALYANAWHHRSDAMSSIPAFIAIVLALLVPEWHMIDSIGAIAVAAILAITAIKIVVPAFSQLIDGGSSLALCRTIATIAMQVPGVHDAHAVRTRSLGSGIYADLHIEVDPELSVRQGHDISECVQEALIAKGPNIVDVVVHIEPASGAQLGAQTGATNTEQPTK